MSDFPIPTVKVLADNAKGYRIIDKAKYDAAAEGTYVLVPADVAAAPVVPTEDEQPASKRGKR